MPSINFSFKNATNLSYSFYGNNAIGEEVSLTAPSTNSLDYAFYNSSCLKTINIEANPTTTMNRFCYSCSNIKNVNFKNNMTPSQFDRIFGYSGIEVFPENLDLTKYGSSNYGNIFWFSKLQFIDTPYVAYCQGNFECCHYMKYTKMTSSKTSGAPQYMFIGNSKMTYFSGKMYAYYVTGTFSGCSSLIKVNFSQFGGNGNDSFNFGSSILNLDSVKHMCSVYQPYATAKPSPQISFGIGLLQTADPETTDYTVKYITADGSLSDNKADGIRNTYIKTLDEITEEGITDYGYSATNSGTTYYAVGELYTALKSLEDRSVSFTVAYN